MSTAAPRPAADTSPTKKRKENKDASQPDASGSYPYPQHYGYPNHGGPAAYGYPPHQPTSSPHYSTGGNYNRSTQQHQATYANSGTTLNYCQPTGGAYAGTPFMSQTPYSRPSDMYGNKQSTSYNSSRRKETSRAPITNSSANSRPDGMVRSLSTSSRRMKDDPNGDKARGSYRCGKCGVPKKGHICPYQPKLKRRADEPPPEMRNAATQVEMDEFLVLRRLNLEIQGFPESYTAAPMGDVGAEPHPSPNHVNNVITGTNNLGVPSISPAMPPGSHLNMNGVQNNIAHNTNVGMNESTPQTSEVVSSNLVSTGTTP